MKSTQLTKIGILLLTLLVFAGCFKTRAELQDEQTNQTQEAQTQTQQKAQAPAKEYREKAPPAAYRFEEYDEQMRQLQGRVDSLENLVNQLNAAHQGEKESVTKEHQALNQRFLAYEDALKKLEVQVTDLADQIAKMKVAAPEKTAAGGEAKGLDRFNAAEDSFGQKHWKEAIANYQKYRDAYPKGKHYIIATLKIGVCFQELGMKDEARAFLQEVSDKFPNSPEAKKAASRLKSLK